MCLPLWRHLHVALGGLYLGIVGVAEFHDRYRLHHGACYPTRSTLPWAPGAVSGAVAFGVSVSADSPRDDDCQEQRRDDAGNTVQDDHRWTRRQPCE